MSAPLVVDLSHHNPAPDFAAMKAAGVVGIIHKCTEGQTYLDDQYFTRETAAVNAGLCWSSYHFLKHGNASAQMDWYLKNAAPGSGDRVCIDYEDEACTLDDLHEAVQRVLDRRPDVEITIYSGNLLKQQLGSNKDALLSEHTSLWVAQYTSAASPSWPKGTYPTWSLWQYTQSATVPGVNGNVDANRWNGDPARLPGWFSAGEEPAPTPEPEPQPEDDKTVEINIEVPDGVFVAVTINGEPVA